MGCVDGSRLRGSRSLHLPCNPGERLVCNCNRRAIRYYTGSCSLATSIEVRVRTRGFLSFAVLILWAASTAFGQTPTPPTPTPPPASAPVPTPTPADTTPEAPAYAPKPQQQQQTQQQQTQPQPTPPAAPTPEKKGPPVVPPAKPTPQAPYVGYVPYAPVAPKPKIDWLGSVYIPVDSWMYPALTRLYGMGFVDTMFLGIRGPILRDSYHLGQTINNDYGRPYQTGFNAIAGASTVEEWGPFSLYVRGEYQHAPSADGYTVTLASQLSSIDEIDYTGPQATIPVGPITAQNPFRLVEAYASFHLLGHEISGGKTDAWLGPAAGASMAWSNNAENIYSLRINRVEPLYIPFVSKVSGPLRYDFFVGSLKGHNVPQSPWVHAEMFSFRPTDNFEFGFERTVIWGGEGHVPVTLHTFFRSFFSVSDTMGNQKSSREDPGARFSDFSFSYRLPLMRKYVTFFADAMSHDDVTPISAPRRASYRTGLYVSQIPKLNRLDFRVEAVSTDPGVSPAHAGQFAYWEIIQRQGYTNKGFIMGDWIGREAKGGQAWLTYHLSGNEWVQLEYLNKKTPFNFIPGGTTQNQFMAR